MVVIALLTLSQVLGRVIGVLIPDAGNLACTPGQRRFSRLLIRSEAAATSE